jgi:hypothetical protein
LKIPSCAPDHLDAHSCASERSSSEVHPVVSVALDVPAARCFLKSLTHAPNQPEAHTGALNHPDEHTGAPNHPDAHTGAPNQPDAHTGAPDYPNAHTGVTNHPDTHTGAPNYPDTHTGAHNYPHFENAKLSKFTSEIDQCI